LKRRRNRWLLVEQQGPIQRSRRSPPRFWIHETRAVSVVWSARRSGGLNVSNGRVFSFPFDRGERISRQSAVGCSNGDIAEAVPSLRQAVSSGAVEVADRRTRCRALVRRTGLRCLRHRGAGSGGRLRTRRGGLRRDGCGARERGRRCDDLADGPLGDVVARARPRTSSSGYPSRPKRYIEDGSERSITGYVDRSRKLATFEVWFMCRRPRHRAPRTTYVRVGAARSLSSSSSVGSRYTKRRVRPVRRLRIRSSGQYLWSASTTYSVRGAST
jgi:hypothetical protein